MKINTGNLVDKNNTAGFIGITDFEGTHMRISKDLLKNALSIIDTMDNAGLDTEYLDVGITELTFTTDTKIFIIFFNKEKSFGYGVAGAIEQ